MRNNIVVFDFETVGYAHRESVDPQKAEPVQVAALPICGKTLKIHYDKAFVSMIRPRLGADKVDPECIKWHAGVRGMSEGEIKKLFDEAPTMEAVWPTFVNFVKSYRTNKTEWGLPVVAGHNILDYDLPILDRMMAKYAPKDKSIFNKRDHIDTMNYMFLWLENEGAVTSFKLDFLRDYFGLDKKGGHDALKDCKDCAILIKRFLKMQRWMSQKVGFAGSFKDWKDE